MSERADICGWLRDLRHSPAVREIGDVGRGLHLAETEIVRLRGEVERLRNRAPDARETVKTTLTDAEREAVEWAIEVADSLAECSGAGTGGEPSREAATLRAIIARLGGDA